MVPLEERAWRPLSVKEVAALFLPATFPWCIAGGYAIEAALGKSFRAHSDIDVLVFREHQTAIREMLADWDCWMADPPGHLRQWPLGTMLPASVHDVWCRENDRDDWRFQLMVDESSGPMWKSRRSERIARPISELILTDATGVPFLAPEVQLFYKAKEPRPKDAADFAAVLPALSSDQRAWLVAALRISYGHENPWLQSLTGLSGPLGWFTTD
jgi:hypothetical protein